MARSDEPAWGERDAQTGYYPQYKLSAEILVRSIRRGDLLWIALADPKAGRVDDFQIAAGRTIDAYQFKWSRYGGNFSYVDLTKGSSSAPGLIKQLADGWTKLKEQNPGFRVVVHLVTNEHPSTSDRLPGSDVVPERLHFSGFVEQAWRPFASGQYTSASDLPEAWRTAWKGLVAASGLNDAKFLQFVRDCRLEFGTGIYVPERGRSLEDARFDKDVREVTEKIIETVADPQHIVRLTREELIDRLGWRSRVDMHNIHVFPVDEQIYEPIEVSEKKLLKALDDTRQGYIAVLGPPGSGKSTLLTQTLLYYPHRVVRYFAYVPVDPGSSIRGESLNFLHDILHQLEQAGVIAGQTPNYPDIDLLRGRLKEHLVELNRQWLETGMKTVILIDGLDHIDREQHPGRSLLKDLLPPDQIPEGIIFVLGSQTDQLVDLSAATIDSLKHVERRIEIEPLDRNAVHRIIRKSAIADRLDNDQLDKICDLSAGHPLDLAYRLKQLETADGDDIASIINSAVPYDGLIRSRYSEHWRQIDSNYALMDLLGMIARLRGVIDMSWIRAWGIDPALLYDLRRRFSYLFRIEDERRWYFFHNSFRQFVIEETAKSYLGIPADQKNAEFHLTIAEKCRLATDPRHKWEEIFHLYAGGNHRGLLDRASPEFFQEQFLSYRSAEAIRGDVLLAIRSAGSLRDVVSLVRAMFCDAEIAQRSANVERYDLANVLLSLDEQEAATEHARIAAKQASEVVKVFRLCVRLAKAAHRKAAERLFDIAEPVEILSGVRHLSEYDRDDLSILKVWARTAIHFRTFAKVVSAIEQIRLKRDRLEREDVEGVKNEIDERSKGLQDQILFELGTSLIRARLWEELKDLYDIVLSRSGEHKYWWLRLRTFHWESLLKNREYEKAAEIFEETLDVAKGWGITNSQLLALANAAYRLTGSAEAAKHYLGELKVSDFQELPDFNIKVSHTKDLYRYLKLICLIGDDLVPTEIIPDPEDKRKAGIVFFQRGLAVVAKLTAAAETGRSIELTELRRETFPLLRLFNHGWHRSEWDSWYSITTDLKPSFFGRLVRTIALFGKQALRDLAEDLEKEWKTNSRFWSSDQIRKIVLSLSEAGLDTTWVTEQLEKVGVETSKLEIPERIGETLELARAWIRVGQPDKAREAVRTALLDSASIGGKDFQLNEWIGWLKQANRAEPDQAGQRIRWYARAVLDLERNGGQSADAAYELLEAAFEWNPRAAIRLFDWFLNEGVLRFEKGVRTLLRSAIKIGKSSSPVVESFLLRFVPAICDADPALIQDYLKAKLESDGCDVMIDFAKRFIDKVNVHALPASRALWRSSVARHLEAVEVSIDQAGLADSDLHYRGSYTSTKNELVLKDGTCLTEKDVNARAVNPQSLLELMRLEDGSNFDWKATIKRNSDSFDDVSIVRSIAEEISWKRSNASLLADLSSKLVELGDIEGAERQVEEILRGDGASGWATHLTGGTRISAFEVLSKIHGDAARSKAFDQLVADLNEEYRYTSSIVLYLDKILPLIIDPLPIKELWEVIGPFVNRTFPTMPTTDLDDELATVLGGHVDSIPVLGLLDLALNYADHPIGMIANSAKRVLTDLVVLKLPAAIDVTRAGLSGSERETETALVVIDSAILKNPTLTQTFSAELASLSDSPNLSHRLIAYNILLSIGTELEIVNEGMPEASVIYDLALPPGRATKDIWEDEPLRVETTSLPETEDPYLLLKSVLPEMDYVARASGIAREILIHRAGQMFSSVAKGDKWSKTSEKILKNRFDRVSLKYPYRRPRATNARLALAHLLAELLDQGRLAIGSVGPLFRVLRPYDPQAYLVEVEKRPDFAARPISWGNGGGFAAPDSIISTMLLRTPDGLLILAESTQLRTLDWERPTEVRRSVVGTKTRSRAEDDFFACVARCDRDQYVVQPSMGGMGISELIIQNEGRWLESPVREWLAFNPDIAVHIGWEPDEERPFGWKNGAGEPMVWSVYWNDGVYDAPPPKIGEQVGEGWAVLATESAFEQIRSSIEGIAIQFLRVDLKYAKDEKVHSETGTLERPIDTLEFWTTN
jgi:hypothetical protein